MALTKDIRLSVLADIAKYQKEFSKIPGFTEKTAAAAASKFEREIRKSQEASAKAAQKAASQAGSSWGNFGSLVKFNVAAVATDALKSVAAATADLVADTMEARRAMIRLSDATGIERDTIAGLEEAFRAVGADSAEVTDQLQDFNEKLFDFGQGGGAAAEAFAGLGIDMEAVRSGAISSDEALRQVLTRLPHLTDETVKAAYGQQLFSDRGLDVTNALERMPLDVAIAQARAFGRTVSDDAVESTARWTESMYLLRGVMSGVVTGTLDWIDLGARLDEALTGSVIVSAALSQALKLVGAELSGIGAAFTGKELPEEELLSVRDAAKAAAVSFQDTRNQMRELSSEGLEVAISVDEMAAALGFAEETSGKQAKTSAEQARAHRDAAQAARTQAAALEELNAIGERAGEDQLSRFELILNARDKELQKIEELARASGDEAHAAVAAEEVKQRAVRNTHALKVESLAELRQKYDEARAADEARELAAAAAAAAAAAEELEELQQMEAEKFAIKMLWVSALGESTLMVGREVAARESARQQEQLDEQRNRLRDLNADQIALEQELTQATNKEQKKRIRAELRGVRQKSRAEAKAVEIRKHFRLNAWKAEKAVALSGVVFETAVAVMKAQAMFGPPPSPIGEAAKATAILSGMTQAAMIASEKPPQFHTGFAGAGSTFPGFTRGPDERTAIIRTTEPVLTQRAGEALGRDRIRELNQTGQMGGGGAVFELSFERRHIDAMVGRTVRAGGRLRRTIAEIGGAGPIGRAQVFGR